MSLQTFPMTESATATAKRFSCPRSVLAAALTCALLGPFAAATAQSQAAQNQAAQSQAAEQAPFEMQEPVREDLSFTLPAGMPIEVDNPYGSVFIRFGGYEHQFDLHVTKQQPAGAPEIALRPERSDGRMLVAPRIAGAAGLAEGQRVDVVLYVPQHHALSVRTGSGNIESRGLKSDLRLRSAEGDIAVRGTEGNIDIETAEGSIEAALGDGAQPGSIQRLATRTGNIVVGVSDKLNAEVRMSTSAQFATDYSLQIEHRDGEEPNKAATAVIGAPGEGKQRAVVVVESKIGEIRVLRRAVYVDSE